MPQYAGFSGAKLALLNRGRVLTMLRDDRPDIPFPGHWDLAGGGREGKETPQQCACRELHEEFGLRLPETGIEYARSYPGDLSGQGITWFFGAEMPGLKPADIRFGNEGQKWLLMPVRVFIMHPQAVPHLSQRLASWLAARKTRQQRPGQA